MTSQFGVESKLLFGENVVTFISFLILEHRESGLVDDIIRSLGVKMGEPTQYLGSKISLISKSEIRYEGILYTIDAHESIIALAKGKIMNYYILCP